MRNDHIAARQPRVTALVVAFSLAAMCAAPIHAAPAATDTADKTVVAVQTVRVQRGSIAQPVRTYGIVAASASNLTTVNLRYVARIVQMRVQAGQSVTRGTPLFVVQADPAAVLAATQAKSALTLAQGELARTQSLFDQGLATQSQLATAKKAVDDARQALAAQNEDGVTNGNKTIVAPLDGVVLQVSAAQGDQVQPGAPILQLAGGNGRDARANVVLGVEPSEAVAIHAGDTVTLRGLSTSLAKAAVEGRVVLVGAAVDQQSQLVNVGANVPLGQSAFIPGTRVAADIATRDGMHWIVPRAAVLKDDQGAYVFQITRQNKARRIAVVMQVENGDRYGVEGPIDAAQGLVVSGNYELKDGMAVQVSGGAPR
ncbi:efflux RND transporter periplasmic adaptor subunit [Paraburkholderia xenovorans]|uniref:efflux RND transporter periplasmic adaptor subunit n=1 Tax=Paraburkholderia xenovorans TaxID=36873 RepID=UPI0038B86A55